MPSVTYVCCIQGGIQIVDVKKEVVVNVRGCVFAVASAPKGMP
jgi:hypothetical protein